MTELLLPNILDGEDKSSPFINRIRKNYRHLRKWAKRTATNCFRIYDREIHSYPLAIDFYDGRYCIHYFSTKKGEEEPSEEFIKEIESALSVIFGASPDVIYWRTRMKTKKTRQYEKNDETQEFFVVQEFGVKFKVNLRDYLDTGLFLDHRETRKLVSSFAKGKRVLNLFAYTCAFSVHCAREGALMTKSVDMSNTYTKWAKDNFLLNHLDLKNHLILREDCIRFLNDEQHTKNQYDLIIIDPPTMSRSKKMVEMFDIQRDYIFLIKAALKLLSAQGTIFFSTNSRKFVLDPLLFNKCVIKEISHRTLPLDFHDPKIHRCWKITHFSDVEDQ